MVVTSWPHRLQVRAELAFGANPAGDPAGWTWTDLSDRLDFQSIAITRGRQNESGSTTAGSLTLTFNNPDGDLTPDRAQSPYYPHIHEGVPLRFSVLWDGEWRIRFVGEVGSWAPSWPYGDLSNEGRGYVGEARVEVTAAGILRRLGQGTPPLYDAMRRHIENNGPLAYWPLTDGETAIHGSEVIQGAMPMRALGEAGSFYQGQPDWGRGSLAPWLDPVVELPDESIGRITANVPAAAVTQWAVDHALAGGGPGSANTLQVFDRGPRTNTAPQHEFALTTFNDDEDATLFVVSRGEDTSSSTLLATPSLPGISDGGVHYIRLITSSGGSFTNWALVYDGTTVASGTHAITHYPVSRIVYRWGTVEGGGVETTPVALGHVTYWETPPPNAETRRALLGHVYEPAGRRIERLCAEQGVGLQVTGSLDDTPLMGPQRSGAFLDVLGAAEAVDGGVLGEARDAPVLAYRTRASRYNQGV